MVDRRHPQKYETLIVELALVLTGGTDRTANNVELRLHPAHTYYNYGNFGTDARVAQNATGWQLGNGMYYSGDLKPRFFSRIRIPRYTRAARHFAEWGELRARERQRQQHRYSLSLGPRHRPGRRLGDRGDYRFRAPNGRRRLVRHRFTRRGLRSGQVGAELVIVVASAWATSVAVAEGVVAVLVVALIINVLRLRDRVTRLEARDERMERLGRR